MGVWKPVDKTEFGLKECAKCEYSVRCQECIYNKKDISRLVAETRAYTVRKMKERLTTFFNNDDNLKYNEVDAAYINEMIDQIAEEIIGGSYGKKD